MREILFRGKRVDNGEWVEGSLVNNIFFRAESNRPIPYIIDTHEYESYDCMEDVGELAVEVFEDTVSQFTGLLDKHGGKIFEGDILLHVTFPKGTGVVSFQEGCFICGEVRINLYHRSVIEIIGNIYDNPELLT